MPTSQEWLNQKFAAWEQAQGRKQSYYAFARYLEVSQSDLAQWMDGIGTPTGDDLRTLAAKLGPEIYEALGIPRPSPEGQKVTISFNNLPPDIRQRLISAIVEADQSLRANRHAPTSPEARQETLQILEKWGFHYSG